MNIIAVNRLHTPPTFFTLGGALLFPNVSFCRTNDTYRIDSHFSKSVLKQYPQALTYIKTFIAITIIIPPVHTLSEQITLSTLHMKTIVSFVVIKSQVQIPTYLTILENLALLRNVNNHSDQERKMSLHL